MKKAAIIIAVFVLLYLAFKSKSAQDYGDRFIKSTTTHEMKQIEKFLSQ